MDQMSKSLDHLLLQWWLILPLQCSPSVSPAQCLLFDHFYIIYIGDLARAPARKIDLAKLFKPQSNPGRLQNDNEHSRSGSVVQSDTNLTLPLRTTASSAIVASKPSSNTVRSKEKKRESNVLDSEEDGGGLSVEDDSHEKEMAMSSPMKGSELRSKKVSFRSIAGHFLTPFY